MGAKGVALHTSPSTCRYPGITGLFPGPPEKGGLELGPTRNQTRPEQNQNSNHKPDQNRTRIQVLCQAEVISLQSSAQAEALRSDK